MPEPEKKKSALKTVLIVIGSIIGAIVLFVAVLIIYLMNNDPFKHQSEEGIKGQLGSLRSAISIYYSEKNGIYPDDLSTFENYLSPIPKANIKELGRTNEVHLVSEPPTTEGTGWAYVTNPNSKYYGNIFANSTATDTQGVSFSTY